MNNTRLLLGLFVLVLSHGLCVNDVFTQQERVIELQNADRLVGREIDGQDARELIGNVRFSQGNVRVQCDSAVQFLRSGIVHLTGNVVVQDDSLILRAPRGAYHRETRRAQAFEDVRLDDGRVQLSAGYGEYFVDEKRAEFRSNVVVHDAGSTVSADSLTYFRKEQRSVALGRVRVYSPADNVLIMGRHLEHWSTRRFSRMTQNPVLVQIDTTAVGTFDTLVVRSVVLESYRDSVKRMLAIDDVEFVRSDLSGVAGLAEFFTEGDSILFRVQPLLWYEGTQVSGDSINVYLEERKLQTIRVMGNAMAISLSDSLRTERFDQVTGETMYMYFVQQALERIDVQTRATSVYHLYEEGDPNGLNKTSGDRILILLENRKVETIKVLGGIEGEYYPENMVTGKEGDFRIAGFNWRTDRPTIRPDDLRLYEHHIR